MGGNSWTHIVAWTFLGLVQVLIADRNLFQDLGLSTLPDITKINISQDEYTNMMTAYLNSRQKSMEVSSVPMFITFNMVKKNGRRSRKATTRLKFPIGRKQNQVVNVDSAQLRILAPAYPVEIVKVQVHQILGTLQRRLLDETVIYLSHNLTKWCEFDVTSAVQSWLNGEKNLGLEITCLDSSASLQPSDAFISVLINQKHTRSKRSNSPYQPSRRTDCRESRSGKRRCCRHNMIVKFADLKFPEMKYIVQPKFYEAGFCQGQCPPNYNHATNHSRIQSLMHQMGRKSKVKDHRPVPKACCAPSKLEPLEILRVNPADTKKLILEKWDNMQVVECACS